MTALSIIYEGVDYARSLAIHLDARTNKHTTLGTLISMNSCMCVGEIDLLARKNKLLCMAHIQAHVPQLFKGASFVWHTPNACSFLFPLICMLTLSPYVRRRDLQS